MKPYNVHSAHLWEQVMDYEDACLSIMKINKSKLGGAIKKIRRALDITQDELSKRTGLTITYLSLLENGKRGIGMDHLNDIAHVFGVPACLLVVLAADVRDRPNEDADQLLKQIQIMSEKAIALYALCQKSTEK